MFSFYISSHIISCSPSALVTPAKKMHYRAPWVILMCCIWKLAIISPQAIALIHCGLFALQIYVSNLESVPSDKVAKDTGHTASSVE